MLQRIHAVAAPACALASLLLLPERVAAAVEVAAIGDKAVVMPYGDWIVAVGQTLAAVLVPVLVTAATGAIYSIVPWAKLFVSTALVERLVRNVTDYGLNAVEGAFKGAELTVPIGSAVIAKSVQRAVDQAPAWLLQAAGGPAGVAEKVFRVLRLEPGATTANTLAPALAATSAR